MTYPITTSCSCSAFCACIYFSSRPPVAKRLKKSRLDQQLVARLVLRLRACGFSSTSMDTHPAKEMSQLLPYLGTSPVEMDSVSIQALVDAMDATPTRSIASSSAASSVPRHTYFVCHLCLLRYLRPLRSLAGRLLLVPRLVWFCCAFHTGF